MLWNDTMVESNEYIPTEDFSQPQPRHSPINTAQKNSTAPTASTSMTPKPAGTTRCSVAHQQWTLNPKNTTASAPTFGAPAISLEN